MTKQAHIIAKGLNTLTITETTQRGHVEEIVMYSDTTAHPDRVIPLAIPSVDHLSLEAK
ncbi:MAG: hypothetical protein KAJ73_00145 [Zetaproteobacteria bacterium]|nr:hypothetical protein [Zetaproteobacteria bacterium]